MNRRQHVDIEGSEETNKSVLVVDDDYNLLYTIQLVLQEEGLSVETAMDGVEALEQAERQRPAVVVLDMGLPLLDGEAVATALRGRYGDTIPLVLITADGHITEKGQRIRASTALGKPFEIDDLVHAVHQALSMNRGD